MLFGSGNAHILKVLSLKNIDVESQLLMITGVSSAQYSAPLERPGMALDTQLMAVLKKAFILFLYSLG